MIYTFTVLHCVFSLLLSDCYKVNLHHFGGCSVNWFQQDGKISI